MLRPCVTQRWPWRHGVASLLAALTGCPAAPPSTPVAGDTPASAPANVAAPSIAVDDRRATTAIPQPASLRWLAAAAGSTPESSQVQIEQDIALAERVFGRDGMGLFGAGARAPVVQVLNPAPAAPPDRQTELLLSLGDLFAPRGGRDAHYRRPRVPTHGAATARDVLQIVADAVATRGPPLLVYLGGHGDMAETPRDNRVLLWGQSEFSVAELGRVLDQAQRPVQVVATTCFSGGFGELAFHDTDPRRGGAKTERCGLFAAPWDLEASGCDPNPDRAGQQGYGLHFLNALRGRDRDGNAVPAAEIDLDADGTISLLEAHTRVRLFSEAADVPTTTSERWLRQRAPSTPRSAAVALPEEDRVIEALSRRLQLIGPGRAHEALDRLDARIEQLLQDAGATAHAEDEAYREAASALLAQWPILDDAWHPDFHATLREHGAGIATHLASSESYARYLAARAANDAAQQAVWAARLESAPVERLVRALENRDLAGRLKAQGGPAWATYAALLACERGRPPPGTAQR